MGLRRSKRKAGRPIELTAAVLARVAKHVELGNYIETAAALEGVSFHYVRELLREGGREERRAREEKRPVDGKLQRAVAFAQAMRHARAKAESDDLAVIRGAGKEHWQARAWRLERRQPDRWARPTRYEHRHSGPGGGAIPFAGVVLDPASLKNLSDEELDALEAIVAKTSRAS